MVIYITIVIYSNIYSNIYIYIYIYILLYYIYREKELKFYRKAINPLLVFSSYKNQSIDL